MKRPIGLNPHLPAGDWTHKTIGDRVRDCAVMLYCHDFLKPAEYESVRLRISEWMAAHAPQKTKKRKAKNS